MTALQKPRKPGTGPVAFGCTFLLIAVVAGLLVARYGDPMFEKIVTTLFFWR